MLSINSLFLLLGSFVFRESAASHCRESSGPFFGAQIILFYAPLYTENIEGQIVIYHFHPNFKDGDKVILLRNDTSNAASSAYYYRPTSKSGVIYTQIPPFDLKSDSTSKFIPRFSGYCAYWKRDNMRSEQFCLTTQPQWMHLNRHIIGNRSLQYLLLPATHQSGSYSKVYPQSLVNRFAATQDLTILEQLIAGARYLDLRPAYKDGIYYDAHDFFFMQPMLKIFYDIKEFLDNTQEIVIISFAQFSRGFDMTIHKKFMNYLETEFEDYYLNVTHAAWTTRLNDIWHNNRRLIIIYRHWLSRPKNFLWPHISQKLGYIAPDDNLKTSISTAEADQRRPRVTMATYALPVPNLWDAIIRRFFGHDRWSIRGLAVSVSSNITQWYNELHYNTSSIIGVDYIQATGIVEFCIEWNLRYSSRCAKHYIIQAFDYLNLKK